ncbi:MAG: twin-arginine translocation signal domain-containing protein, partial [Acidobacteriaceae bacterium]
MKKLLASECSKDARVHMLEKRMLTRRRFLGYAALAPAALRSTFWTNPAPQISERAWA